MCSVQGHYSLSYFRQDTRLKIYFQKEHFRATLMLHVEPNRRGGSFSSSSFDLLTEDAVSTTS